MKTEAEVKNKITKDWILKFSREEIKSKMALDIHLATMSECIQLGIDCPIAWAEVEKVVQEPDDFWTWCLGEAWVAMGDPPRLNECSSILLKLLAIKIGRETLLEAYQDGY